MCVLDPIRSRPSLCSRSSCSCPTPRQHSLARTSARCAPARVPARAPPAHARVRARARWLVPPLVLLLLESVPALVVLPLECLLALVLLMPKSAPVIVLLPLDSVLVLVMLRPESMPALVCPCSSPCPRPSCACQSPCRWSTLCSCSSFMPESARALVGSCRRSFCSCLSPRPRRCARARVSLVLVLPARESLSALLLPLLESVPARRFARARVPADDDSVLALALMPESAPALVVLVPESSPVLVLLRAPIRAGARFAHA
jgi:hypothetical protein